jgi:hypothetical protein
MAPFELEDDLDDDLDEDDDEDGDLDDEDEDEEDEEEIETWQVLAACGKSRSQAASRPASPAGIEEFLGGLARSATTAKVRDGHLSGRGGLRRRFAGTAAKGRVSLDFRFRTA